jgi:hypothetical protein
MRDEKLAHNFDRNFLREEITSQTQAWMDYFKWVLKKQNARMWSVFNSSEQDPVAAGFIVVVKTRAV